MAFLKKLLLAVAFASSVIYSEARKSLSGGLIEDDDAPELLEMHPTSFSEQLDLSVATVVAFVNPSLPSAYHFHPILHELNQYYSKYSPNIKVGWVDVEEHRNFFMKRFAIRSLPSILAFPRGPNLNRVPVYISYLQNKTVDDYRREIDQFSAAAFGLHSQPYPLRTAVSNFMESVLSLGSTDAVVSANGESSSSPLDESSVNETTSALQQEIASRIVQLELEVKNLQYLSKLLPQINKGGIGELAHLLNKGRSDVFERQSSHPIDADLSSRSSSLRNEDLGEIAVLTDIFAGLPSEQV